MEIPGIEAVPEDQRDEAHARLADLGPEFEYVYDFGDDWSHRVEMLGPGDAVPGCVDGRGACPPEDCGGPGGYAELLDVLADPAHPDHERLRTWAGNRPREFDRAATDHRVRQVVGEVPESVRILLAIVADGVRLTPGGRLPRAVVREMHQHRPQWYPLGRPASIEEDLLPLAMLHDLLRRVGLLRLRRGVLAPIRAADDELEVVRRLRTAFAPHTFATQLTELTIGVLAARGPLSPPKLATHVHELVGGGWQRDGQPITDRDVLDVLRYEAPVMAALDLIDRTDRSAWALGPSAKSLLPRANMLAEVWADDG